MNTDRWRTEFDAFVARKTQDATTAALPPYRTELAGETRGYDAIGNTWSTTMFDGPFYVSPPDDSRPSCSLVFVQSAEGNTGADNPGALGGGLTDKHLIYEGLSRVAADAVMAGANTVRSGSIMFSVWHPELVALRTSLGLSRHPTQIVASNRGVDVENGLLFNIPDAPVVLLTSEAGAQAMASALAARPWVQIVKMDGQEALPSAFRELRALGLRRISCVGGRTLATTLIDAHLVDDLYLTMSPKSAGEPGTRLYPRAFHGDVIVRKHGTSEEVGVIFEHVHLVR